MTRVAMERRRLGPMLDHLDPLEGRAQDLDPSNIEDLRAAIKRLPEGDSRREILHEEMRRILSDAAAINMDVGTGPTPGVNGDPFDELLGADKRVPAGAPGAGGDPFQQALPNAVTVKPAAQMGTDAPSLAPGVEVGTPREPSMGQVLGRIGVETLTGTLGALAGARAPMGGPIIGSAAGTYLGSRLASKTFDPVADPHGEATTSAVISGITTPIGGALSKLFSNRRVFKKGAEEALEFFTKKGITPPPSTILKSELVQDIQNVGEGAFGVGGRLTAMREAAEQVTEDEIKHYGTTFAAAEKAAKKLYAQVDAVAPHLRVDLKGLPGILDKIEAERLLVGMPDQVKAIFQNIRNNQVVSFEQAQQLRTTLLNMGRLMDNVDPEAAKVIARRVEPYLDQAISDAGKNIKLKGAGLQGFNDVYKNANEAWLQHKQGLIIDDLIRSSESAGNISGKSLMNRIDKSSMAERLSGPQRAELRRLAAALMVAEDKSGSGAFKFIGRQAQFVGGLGLITGTAPVAGAVALLGPPALAWVMSNPKIARLLITGVRSGPGTETGIRALTQLTSVLQRQGFLPPNRGEPDADVPTE